MGLLNLTTDGLPSVGIVITRLLVEKGPKPKEELRMLCDPRGLNSDSDSQVDKTINRWLQLGVLKESEGQISVAPELQDSELFVRSDPLLERLRWNILRCVLRTADPSTPESPADDFIVAAWWLLQQDPARVQLTSAEAAISAAGEEYSGQALLQNRTRWPGWREWTTFLGLGTFLGGHLIPNPTAAVRWALRDLDFASGTAIPAVEFLAALEKQIPLLGEGAAAKTAAQHFSASTDRGTEQFIVPPSLSLALMSLRSQGLLDVEGNRDAPSVALFNLPGARQRRVERIIINGPNV